ncbi:Fur family transcriptional regulator [Prevotella sp. E2-28]|uniref:Fur family transcriptional regulator n=1 Tax=Prevotella sp. E2-28 TaxID=2913620 RepID=UPI001EDB7E7E|nr:transcriptional repressor [Prevotella sp. E2-28]UKK54837.1 transcriptional repressor [Prevotella sp. E2-28]
MKTIEKRDRAYSAVEHILDSYLEMNDHRKTPERYAILRAVYNTEGHFTIDELGERLVEEYKFPVSRATLYNTLNLFLELRLVIRHRFQGTTKYESCYADNNHCHQICTVCGKVSEVHAPEVANAIDEMRLKRFRKDGFSLYIYGICSTCQAAITRKSRKAKSDKAKK